MSEEITLAERLVNRLANWRRPSRRSMLAAATLGGAALATNPWDFLTKPQDAYASVCGPGSECNEGWSAMCCSINNGHNTCPPHTFPGGWWKADRSSYCGGHARYYIDCNAKPDAHFRCHCNTGSCDHRRVACNIFRYGQCNTQIKGTTAVVCRQISCRPPWQVYPGDCGHSPATDNNTAEHNAPCLTHDNTFPRRKTYPKAPAKLHAGEKIHWHGRLTAPNRHTTLHFTEHGNLALVNQDGAAWSAHTHAVGAHALLKGNGDFVVINAHGHEVWSTKTAAGKDAHPLLELHDGGNLVLTHGGKRVWSTHTSTP
jgi:hypothetical protein